MPYVVRNRLLQSRIIYVYSQMVLEPIGLPVYHLKSVPVKSQDESWSWSFRNFLCHSFLLISCCVERGLVMLTAEKSWPRVNVTANKTCQVGDRIKRLPESMHWSRPISITQPEQPSPEAFFLWH